jgi:hypothetical protein
MQLLFILAHHDDRSLAYKVGHGALGSPALGKSCVEYFIRHRFGQQRGKKEQLTLLERGKDAAGIATNTASPRSQNMIPFQAYTATSETTKHIIRANA